VIHFATGTLSNINARQMGDTLSGGFCRLYKHFLFFIQYTDTMECLRNGKDHMIMANRVGLVGTLALWTVTVAATVVTDLIVSTMVTPVLMTAQG
jgi:hypothetical protein